MFTTASGTAVAARTAEQPWPSPARAWYAVGVMTVALCSTSSIAAFIFCKGVKPYGEIIARG